jgi:hypothetical protein
MVCCRANNEIEGLLGVSNFFLKILLKLCENTILEKSERQIKENENFVSKKKILATLFDKHFEKNPLKCLISIIQSNILHYLEHILKFVYR